MFFQWAWDERKVFSHSLSLALSWGWFTLWLGRHHTSVTFKRLIRGDVRINEMYCNWNLKWICFGSMRRSAGKTWIEDNKGEECIWGVGSLTFSMSKKNYIHLATNKKHRLPLVSMHHENCPDVVLIMFIFTLMSVSCLMFKLVCRNACLQSDHVITPCLLLSTHP